MAPGVFQGRGSCLSTSQPVQPNLTHSILNRVILKMTNFDLLVDGYIAYTFTPQAAAVYLRQLCKINNPREVQTFSIHGWPGAFFITNPPMNHCRAHHIGNNQYAWLLDCAIRHGGTVVPQLLWSPQGQGDWRRYVEKAQLHLPVFFVNADGSLGVPVAYAAAGQMSLRNGKEPPPLGDKTTTKIRISWPGYTTSEHQVQLRDQTPTRNPVTFERFVKHVGSRVRQYLIECERPVNNPYSPWFVGPNGITFNEVFLIGVVQVSEGSWMPILQLMQRIVM
ncbi:hypothetical protein BJV78DRAFT_577941 [Lactifluus subvellereus]|nr:hypothetical protein BJV78DRAFT_577941 [Lactifluus subvellereus]